MNRPSTGGISLNTAIIGLLFGAVIISFSGIWVRTADVSPIAAAFYRVFFGGLMLLLVVLVRGELKRKKPPNLGLVILCGLLFSLDLSFYHLSIHYVGPGLGTILANLEALMLAALGILFFKEKLRRAFFLSVPLAFLGLFLIVGPRWGQMDSTYRIGIYCGVATAVCYTGFLLSLRRLQADQAGSSMFYILMLVSFVTAAFLGGAIWGSKDTFKIPDMQTFLILIVLALLSQTMGWILIANALPKVRASLSGLILLLQPALAFIWDVLFFHRPTRGINWIGVALVLAAIYLGTMKTSDHG